MASSIGGKEEEKRGNKTMDSRMFNGKKKKKTYSKIYKVNNLKDFRYGYYGRNCKK